jgi:hypothetical protein
MSANPYTTPFIFQPPQNPRSTPAPTICGRMAAPYARQRTTQACNNCRERKTKVRPFRADLRAWLIALRVVLWQAPSMSTLLCSWPHLLLYSRFEPRHEKQIQASSPKRFVDHGLFGERRSCRHEYSFCASAHRCPCSKARPPIDHHPCARHLSSGSDFAEMGSIDTNNITQCLSSWAPE